MTERYDAMTARQYVDRNGEKKTAWTKIGTMWVTAKGFRLNLDAMPVPSLNDKGEVETSIVMFPPKPREDAGGFSQPNRAPGAAPRDGGISDEVPF